MKALYFLIGGIVGSVITYTVMKRKVDNVLVQYDETVEELRKLQKKDEPKSSEPDPTEKNEEIHPTIDRAILDVKETVDKTTEDFNKFRNKYREIISNYDDAGYGDQYEESTGDEFDDGDDDLERIELMAFEDGTIIETCNDQKVSITETIGYNMLHKLQAMKWGVDDKVIYVKNTKTKCFYEVMANKDTYSAYMDGE